MQQEKFEFADAVIKIAKDHHIAIPKVELSEADLIQYLKQEGIKIANEMACKWFEENLPQPENAKALHYVL